MTVKEAYKNKKSDKVSINPLIAPCKLKPNSSDAGLLGFIINNKV